eukprot:7930932-Karenia_brevis.AAC.1
MQATNTRQPILLLLRDGEPLFIGGWWSIPGGPPAGSSGEPIARGFRLSKRAISKNVWKYRTGIMYSMNVIQIMQLYK